MCVSVRECACACVCACTWVVGGGGCKNFGSDEKIFGWVANENSLIANKNLVREIKSC